jgi:hypothetical protein
VIRKFLVGILAASVVGVLTVLPVAAADASPSPTANTPSPAVLDQGVTDRVSFGTDIHIAAGQSARDVFCMGCSVFSEGTIARDLVVMGGNAEILGPVGRDAFVLGGHVHLGPKASVARDLNAVGGSATVDPGATVGRDRTAVGGLPVGSPGGFGSFNPFGSLIPGLVLIVLAMLAMTMFPRQLAVTASLVEARPFASFGLGCFGIVAAIALAILFAITLILIPVSLILTLAVSAAWLFGWAAIFLVVGNRFLVAADQRPQPLAAVVVGGVLFALLALIPLISIPIGLVGGAVALGAALGSRFGTRREQTDFFAFGRAPAPYQPTYPPAPHPPVQMPPQDPPEANT